MSNNPLTAGLGPVHPGSVLREDVFPALKKPVAEIARLLGVSRQTLYDIMNEKKPITAQMALRIGKLLGGDGDVWLRLQASFDMKMARIEMADTLKNIPTLPVAV